MIPAPAPTHRYLFGVASSDWAVTLSPVDSTLKASDQLGTAWDAQTGGNQLTDLEDTAGNAVSNFRSRQGQYDFYGPVGVKWLWVDFGGGQRELLTSAAGFADAVEEAAVAAANASSQRELAEAAAAASEAVGNTNDGIIAGRLNEPASASRTSGVRTFARGISLTQPEFGAEVATVATHQGAFAAALTVAGAARCSLHVPAGQWTADDLIWPTNVVIRGEGDKLTRIRRSTDKPLLKVRGAAYTGQAGFFPDRYGQGLEHIGLYNTLSAALTPLVDIAGASHMKWLHVAMESYQDGPGLLRLSQVWDSEFKGLQLASGGKSDGTVPSLELTAGFTEGATTWRQSKELVFNDFWAEDYFGIAIAATRPDGYTTTKVEQIKFTGRQKFESLRSTTAHMVMTANHIDFENVYFRHWLTAGPVVDLVNVRGAEGLLRFFGGPAGGAYIKPSARLRIAAASQLLDLLVHVAEPQAADENVITAASPSDETNRLRIVAPVPLLNGVNVKNVNQVGQWFEYYNASGQKRRSLGFPTTLTEGSAIGADPVVSSANLNSISHAINTIGKAQGNKAYCSTLAKPVWTNGSAPGDVWRDAAGTVTHTPV